MSVEISDAVYQGSDFLNSVTYKFVEEQNMDAYYRVTGVGYITRKLFSFLPHTLQITQQTKLLSISAKTPLLPIYVSNYPVGERFLETLPHGETQNTIVSRSQAGEYILESLHPVVANTRRIYTIGDNHLKMHFEHEGSGVIGIKLYDRIFPKI